MFDCATVEEFKVRVKLFDYGVISVMLTRPFAGSWRDLTALGQQLIESDAEEREATRVCHAAIARVRPALGGLRQAFLSEDYIVFAATAFETPQSEESLVGQHGAEIAQIVRGELSPLSAQEIDDVLSHRLMGRRHTRATRRLHTLFIDVNELTDHMENAVKVVGDVYAARLVSSVAARVGVPDWKANVREKLKTLDDIHRFAVEQTTSSRATLLEATVVLILIIELGMLLAGL